ncbi:hypothetical protein JCM19240_5999 [Vibrio maritimus]|uniref:Uncharacterized protein n=1 Tax=Vibrio maritimus TaxID=990268 RepID=A0A090TMV1_9VIBR|nr:hypothetical protein JCM19240_5999 [Vibrio maritimus]
MEKEVFFVGFKKTCHDQFQGKALMLCAYKILLEFHYSESE